MAAIGRYKGLGVGIRDMPDIQEYYEQYWEAPELYHDPTSPQRRRMARRHLAALPEGSAVLDVGCGRGELCAFFKQLGLNPQGIDISERVIDFARRQHPGIVFHTGQVQSLLPDQAGSFDCVFSSEVIEHLFDVGGYLEAINRLLKGGEEVYFWGMSAD